MKARLPQGYGGGQKDLLKQAQKMQEEMARVQQEIEEMEFSSSSGGGAVTVTVSGQKKLLSVDLQPEVVDPEDIEMLGDLIIAAVNEALTKADEMSSEEMAKVTGGLGMPGMF